MQIAILSFFHYFTPMFKKRESVFEVEEGKFLSPKFDANGLIPVVTTGIKPSELNFGDRNFPSSTSKILSLFLNMGVK